MSDGRSPTWMRDHLANERTLLAWVRTGLALMAFGLGIAKIATFIHLAALDHPEMAASLPAPWLSKALGAALIIIGGASGVFGLQRTIWWGKEVPGSPPPGAALYGVAAVTVASGIGLTLYVLMG